MTTVQQIRPHVRPRSLREALATVDGAKLAYAGTNGWETTVTGVTVASDDCDTGWIFIAIPGLVNHGARFAASAVASGAAAVVTDEQGAQQLVEQGLDCPIVTVPDPRSAASLIANALHDDPAQRLRTFAVTGTNGKTTTSFMMRSLLRALYPNTALCGTVQTQVGSVEFLSSKTTYEAPVVYRFLDLAAQENCEAAVVETSSHALSLGRVDGIVFDVVGFTNLQHDHLDFYGDMATYFEAKARLFTPAHARCGVVCVDDEWGQRLAEEATIPVTTVAALTDHAAQWHVQDIGSDIESATTTFTLISPEGIRHPVSMPILGTVNVQNAAVALLSAIEMGMGISQAVEALSHCDQVPGRMEIVNPRPGNQPLVVVDFAHTSEGLEGTLSTLKECCNGKLVLVFGTDGDRDASKRAPLGEVAARSADILWITDENPRFEDPQSIREYLIRGVQQVRPTMHDVTEILTSRRDAVRKAILSANAGDIVAITGKGSEWYQDIEGIKHVYNDVDVSLEVLSQDLRAKEYVK